MGSDVVNQFDLDVDTGFFPLESVVATSEFFEHGARPYRLLRTWKYAASRAYRIRLLDRHNEVVFVKLLANESENQIARHRELIAKEYRILEDLRAQPWCGESHTVIEPLECVRAKLALITRESTGDRLDRLLLNSFTLTGRFYDRILSSMRNSGSWLRSLHDATGQEVGTKLDHYISDEVQATMNNLATLRLLQGWEDLYMSCTNYIAGAFERVDRARLRLSLCHGDFGPGNVLVKPHGEIVVLDFSDSRPGIILKDLASFWRALTDFALRRPWHETQRVDQLKETLLEGFFRPGDYLQEVFSVFRVIYLIERAAISAVLLSRMGWNIPGRWQRRRVLTSCRRQLEALTRSGR